MKIKMNTNKKYLVFAIISLALSACVSNSVTPDPTGLSFADGRINDIVLHADNAVFAETEKRLFELIDRGRSADSYFMAKARAWLDFAVDEHRENEIDGTDNLALEQAQIIISDLENGRNPSMVTPLINGVPRLREDLWSHGETLKRAGEVVCAEQYVARLEVQLVWVGHEFGEMGWRHAEPYIRIAEQLKSEIDVKLSDCNAESLQAELEEPQQEPESEPDSVQAVPAVVQHTPLMANRVHFEFNRSDLSPDAEVILGFVAFKLKQEPELAVGLLGYSDERGSLNYNQGLSQRRADAVSAWLRNAGIAPDRLHALGQGETDEHTTLKHQHRLDRRVEIHLTPAALAARL